MYSDMEFAKLIKSRFMHHPNGQVRNYIIMMSKITLDFYMDYPIKCSRFMDFEVPVFLNEFLGKSIEVYIDNNMSISIKSF